MAWWAAESKASNASREKEPELTQLCDMSQALIAFVLNSVSGSSETLTAAQQVMLLATNQAFNSLRSAWGLAFAGFPAQALALVRLAHEWNVLLRFARAYPDEVSQVFMSGTAKTGALAKELFADEPVLAARFQLMRSSLNPFAHQSDLALNMTIRPDAAGRYALNLGPFVDSELLRETGYEVLSCSVLVIAELFKWLGGKNPDWVDRAVPFSTRAVEWLEEVRPPPERSESPS